MIQDLPTWKAAQRFTPRRRLAFYFKRDSKTVCVASPYWPALIDAVRQFAAWRPREKVWEFPIAYLPNIVGQLLDLQLNVLQSAALMLKQMPSNGALDRVDVFQRNFASPRAGHLGQFSKETIVLWGPSSPGGRVVITRDTPVVNQVYVVVVHPHVEVNPDGIQLEFGAVLGEMAFEIDAQEERIASFTPLFEPYRNPRLNNALVIINHGTLNSNIQAPPPISNVPETDERVRRVR
jgi:hypothetical protein